MTTCKNCGVTIIPHQAIRHDGCCTESCLEVWTAVNVINQKPAKRIVKGVSLFLIGIGVSSIALARDYTYEARRLARISHQRADVAVIAKALRAVDLNAKALPTGFDRRDMIALALTESALYHREINTQCVGELGLYQTRPEWYRRGEDGLQVSINTAMAVRVLRNKHATAKRLVAKRHSPYGIKKTTIICYNGWRLNDQYYRAWARNRRRVDLALGKTNSKTSLRLTRDSRTVTKTPHFPVVACIYPAKPTAAQLSEAQYLEEMSQS